LLTLTVWSKIGRNAKNVGIGRQAHYIFEIHGIRQTPSSFDRYVVLTCFIFAGRSKAMQALYILWQIRLSVRLSVTLRYCVKMRKCRGMRS